MSHRSHFDNPDFREYVRLLFELHRLIREGADESPEGDALRDRMDAPASRLSSDEIESVNAISADFYTLADRPGGAALPQTDEVRADLRMAMEARDRRDFSRALDLLRQRAAHINPAALSYMRGEVWREAGEDAIAVRFYGHASQLDPANENYAYVVLDCLSRDQVADARTLARQILEGPESRSTRLVLKAAAVVHGAAHPPYLEEARRDLESLIPILERVIDRLETSGEGGSQPSLLVMALGLAKDCSSRLGLAEQADRFARYYDWSLGRWRQAYPVGNALPDFCPF